MICRRAGSAILGLLLAAGSVSLAATGHAQGQSGARRILSPSGGTVRALVIGIDVYEHKAFSQLSGAVADAQDISATLRRMGANDVTTLLNEKATRAAVVGALERMRATVRPGDLVVISFAGHGSQEPTEVSWSEPDGLDEVFMLGGFQPEGARTRERIIDDEMFLWLSRLTEAGAYVLFVADICHAGGISKSLDPSGRPAVARGVKRVLRSEEVVHGTYHIPGGSDLLDRGQLTGGEETAALDLPTLTFVAAVESAGVAQEVPIAAGQYRGLASYAVARALEGAADADNDGVVTRQELLRYVRSEVQRLSEHTQSPVIEPREGEALQEPVFVLSGRGAKTFKPPLAVATGKAKPRVAEKPQRPRLTPVQLSYAPATTRLTAPDGALLASGIARDQVGLAAQAFDARRQLRTLAEQTGGSRIAMQPEKPEYGKGERVTLAARFGGMYVTVIAISAVGKVQLVFPRTDQDALIQSVDFKLDLVVGEAKGPETIAVLASSERPTAAWGVLRRLDGTLKPLEAFDAIYAAMTGRDRLGVGIIPVRPN